MYLNKGYEVKILKYDLGLRFPHFLLYIRRNHIGSLKVPFFPGDVVVGNRAIDLFCGRDGRVLCRRSLLGTMLLGNTVW